MTVSIWTELAKITAGGVVEFEGRLVWIAHDYVWFALPGRASEDVAVPTGEWIDLGRPEIMPFRWIVS